MQIPRDAVLLRIFFGEDDKFEGRPLYEAIVMKAREMHLAGATVLRGPMGFGKSSLIHTDKILRLSMDLPLVIEIVDSEENINAFLPVLDGMMDSGLVTLEKLQVLQYGLDKIGHRILQCKQALALEGVSLILPILLALMLTCFALAGAKQPLPVHSQPRCRRRAEQDADEAIHC